jgi:hypothetical protein
MCASNKNEFVVKHTMRSAIANNDPIFFTAIGAKRTNVLNTPLLGSERNAAGCCSSATKAVRSDVAPGPGPGPVKDANLPARLTVEARFTFVPAESAIDQTNREWDGVGTQAEMEREGSCNDS